MKHSLTNSKLGTLGHILLRFVDMLGLGLGYIPEIRPHSVRD